MAQKIEVLYYVDASADAVTQRTAQYFTDGIRAAAGARGKARIAISGGHTPKNAFAHLADPSAQYREQIPWDNLAFPSVRWSLQAWHETADRPLGAPAGNPDEDPRGVHRLPATSGALP